MTFIYLFRLCLACGGVAVNCLEDLSVDYLGHAGLVYECALVSISVGSGYKE